VIRCVLFDLMGTLLIEDTACPGDLFGNFHRVLREEGLGLSRDELHDALAEVPAVAVEGPTTPFADRLMRICDAGGLTLSVTRALELADRICHGFNEVMIVDPIAEDAVVAMRSFGAIGLVTNFDHPHNVHRLLERERWRDRCLEAGSGDPAQRARRVRPASG